MSASDKDWYFSDATISNLRELIISLQKLYGIDNDHVVRHYDVTAKWCPRPFMGDDINALYGKSGNQMWAEFKASLEDNEEMIVKYETVESMPEWARETMQKLFDKKYITRYGFTEEALRVFVVNDRAGLYK
jgi:N-acetylmuramoyl-L-alanine amidase CwlA